MVRYGQTEIVNDLKNSIPTNDFSLSPPYQKSLDLSHPGTFGCLTGIMLNQHNK